MADDTSVAPTVATYQAPTDFQGRRDAITGAYQTATDKLAAAKSAIQLRYGYLADGSGLDTKQQYGQVQQNLHNEGQQYQAASTNAQLRGLGTGDGGLGAQRESLARYTAGITNLNTANSRTSDIAGNDQQQTDALAQEGSDQYGVDQDQANYNAGQTALAQAQADWLASQQGAGGGIATNTGQAGSGAVVGAKPVTPAMLAQNARAGQTSRNTGVTGYNPITAKKPATVKTRAL